MNEKFSYIIWKQIVSLFCHMINNKSLLKLPVWILIFLDFINYQIIMTILSFHLSLWANYRLSLILHCIIWIKNFKYLFCFPENI